MASSESPSTRTVHAALRKTTETLASELGRPSGALPDWTEFEWLIARASAAIHGVSPLLSGTLRWSGPDDWVRFLQDQKQHTARRQHRIDELLSRIDERARSTGLAVIALKGAALHAMNLYADGERPMADLDLLVRAEDIASAARVLREMSFHQSEEHWKHRLFVPDAVSSSPRTLGEHANADIKIDLHERICEILPLRMTEISQFIFPARLRPGLNAYPSNAALMGHLLLHAAGAMAYRTLRLVNLHDIALLSTSMTEADWAGVVRCSATAQGPWWAFPPLRLAARYYDMRIPDRVVAALNRHCPWWLRRLTARRRLADVSLSYIWVEAFPGIEWAQSVSEAGEYVARRIWPSEQTLARRKVVPGESFASTDRWRGLSQGRRILKYTTSRVTRAASIQSVRCALGQLP